MYCSSLPLLKWFSTLDAAENKRNAVGSGENLIERNYFGIGGINVVLDRRLRELIPLCAAWQEALSRDIDRQDEESAAFLENISFDDCEASSVFVERYRETVERLRSSVERLKAAIVSTSEMAVAAQREILSGMRAGAPAA
ncbi:hypothetical protein AXG93_2566s1170 [Marchantia polymorpha subsp. ruderalis]|uniref:Uncharacterized protein n=1 Tax=Marchantia polymorpha subsp. ruderalis TaxID=1480154 RepID=A0A176VBV6_MARPO|nr:hypothetical protein AXG93_2566s1170 [Marchantia polymorpha subsp. ruderalis]